MTQMQRRTSTRHASIGGHDGAARDSGLGAQKWLREHTLSDVLRARSDAACGGPPADVKPGASPADVLCKLTSLGVHNLLVDGRLWLRDHDVLGAIMARQWNRIWETLPAALPPISADTSLEIVLGTWAAAASAPGQHNWLPPVLVDPSGTQCQDAQSSLRVVTAADVLRYAILHHRALSSVLDADVCVLAGTPPGPGHLLSARVEPLTVLRALVDYNNTTDVVGVTEGEALVASVSVRRALSLLATGGLPSMSMDGIRNGLPESTEKASKQESQTSPNVTPSSTAFSPIPSDTALHTPRAISTALELSTPPVTISASIGTVGATLARMLKAKSHCAWIVDDFGRPVSLVLLADVVGYLHGALS